ncbi:MAG: MFS transporter, partial [Muribaculaceae bacterium]|nr:MFS transporter [Muribaculaceae bacterium]
VLLSLGVTLLSLVMPIFGNSFTLMLIAFSLLGIGNAIMQTSLNPLVSNLIAPSKLASTLTFGQFVKAIASFIAPIIMGWGATALMPTFGLDWRVLFPIFAVVCLLSVAVLGITPIKEERPDKASSIVSCFKLLGRPFILLCFLGIMCHVGIDVGTNTTAPKILIERLGLTIDAAGFATSVYFIFRTIGCFTGSFILQKLSARTFLAVSVVMMLAGMLILFVGDSLALLYTGIGLIGYGNSNVFSIVFAQALNSTETEKNEVSGLMIMGLFGGTVFPLAMGLASDAVAAQWGAVAVMTVGVIYLALYNLKMKKQ